MLLLAVFTLKGADTVSAYGVPSAHWELVTDVFLGVDSEALSKQEREGYGSSLYRGQGLKITRVAEGSPAEKAGIQKGDLLLILNGRPLASPKDLLMNMRYCRPNIPVFIQVMRDGKTFVVSAVIAARPHPVAVGRIVPHSAEGVPLDALKPHQIRVARLLTQTPPSVAALHAELDVIGQLIHSEKSPGNLRLYFTTPDCTITVTKLWKCISVTMQEKGRETSCELKAEGDALPDAMRLRLLEMLKPKQPKH